MSWTYFAASAMSTQAALRQGLAWLAAVFAAVVVAAVICAAVRRRLRNSPPLQESGLTLQDLRRLRDQGRLTVQEFERLKETILRAALGKADLEPAAKPDKVFQRPRRS